jgi:hypothetical protein
MTYVPVVDRSYQCDYALCSKSPTTYVDFFPFFSLDALEIIKSIDAQRLMLLIPST